MLRLECTFQLLVHKLLDLLSLFSFNCSNAFYSNCNFRSSLEYALKYIRNLVGLSLKDLWEGIQGAEVVNLV